MGWDGKDRRRRKRYGVKDSTLTYRKGGLLSFLMPPSARYLLLNVSELGAHFITRDDLAVGQALKLSVSAPQSRGTVHATARVVWSRKSEELHAYRVGVEITGLSEGARRRLKVLLDGAILENVELSTKVYLKEIERL